MISDTIKREKSVALLNITELEAIWSLGSVYTRLSVTNDQRLRYNIYQSSTVIILDASCYYWPLLEVYRKSSVSRHKNVYKVIVIMQLTTGTT